MYSQRQIILFAAARKELLFLYTKKEAIAKYAIDNSHDKEF